jgi:hypothetical protein
MRVPDQDQGYSAEEQDFTTCLKKRSCMGACLLSASVTFWSGVDS